MDIKHSFHEVLLIICLLCMDQGLCFMTDDDYFDEPSFNRCPWIRNKLKNGRVRYRYKGRVAKFLCDSGFELAGKRSSTCVRGQWSNPVPVCVARGCPRVPSISNGRITEMYRGALLVYDCNPGYMLDGNPTIHCDGRRWNTSPPVCVIATEKPETYCDFENPDLCGWTHDPNHDFDWQRNQFSTPSGHVGTGPAFDHTFGENKGGFYLYIEASSPRKINDTARLFSPVYPEDLSGGCFIFWYHMYGATTGGLRVYLKPESHVFDELKPNWQKFGDQGNQWLKGHMIVPVLHENFQVVIEGVRGESYVGDSAIDDVRLISNLCDSDDNSTDVTETVDQHSCRGRCQESGTESSCGCNANCVDEPNFCCRDYYTICTAGNSTVIQNTDEPLPEDYTTSSTITSTLGTYTTVKHTEEVSAATTYSQTKETELTKNAHTISFSTLTSASLSTNLGNTTQKSISSTPVTDIVNHTFVEKPTSIETTILSDVATSTPLKTEASTISTTENVTKFISTSTPILISDTTAIKTSLKTTISSTIPQTTSTILLTITPITKQATTSETTSAESTTEETTTTTTTSTTTFSTLTAYLEKTTQSVSLTDFGNSSETTVSNNSSFATDNATFSSFAATSSESESTTLLTTTLTSTRKTYNLRPRNRTSSTIPYTTVPIAITPTSRLFTEIITSSPITTSSRSLTSWYRYSVSPFTQQQRTSTSIVSKSSSTFGETSNKNRLISETSTETVPYTATLSSRYTKPTKSPLPKTSDFYESKSKTTSSNGSVPVVVSVVIVIVICLVAGLAYYLKKQKCKRQSKLSDDSEMRFLPDSDYMEYSDASALDRILVK